MRIKKSPIKLTDEKDPTLLDVFVIGSSAHDQLKRFLSITNIVPNQAEFLKLTDEMELRELTNANQAAVNGNGFAIGQQQILDRPQTQSNQVNLSSNNPYCGQPSQQQSHKFVNNSKVSKHRELPVDVPDSFVGMAKQSPRYPPPKPHRQVSPPMPASNLTTFSHAPSSIPYNSSNTNGQQPIILPNVAQTTATNIMTHNSSLRESIKLKQLEKSRSNQHGDHTTGQMQPAINQAFELNEDDDGLPAVGKNHHNGYHQSKKAMIRRQHSQPTKQSAPDLCSIYDRLQKNLNGDLADIAGDEKLAKTLSIYQTIVHIHDKQFTIPILSSRLHSNASPSDQEAMLYKVPDLRYLVEQILRQEDMTSDVAELLSILCKHEIEGVCSAFDRITQLFDFAKPHSPASPSSIQQDASNDNSLAQNPVYIPQHGKQNEVYHGQTSPIDQYECAHNHLQMDLDSGMYHEEMHPMRDISLHEGTCTKTVKIDKSSNHALGATIKNDGSNVVIGRIVCGGVAHRSGLLNEGDEILKVNGMLMRGKNINDVVDIIDSMEGTLTFTIVSPNYNKPPQRNLQEKVFVKAFFDFDGENDDFIPCRELGLSFKKGEVLAIIDQSDETWWQARKEVDSESPLAGLIPSIKHLTQRENHLSTHNDVIPNYFNVKHEKKNIVSKLFHCPKGSSPKRKKKLLNMPFGPEDIPFYEEVHPCYPNVYRKRPIILVGPKMIGQREIVTKLLQDTDRFASAISHTSRPRQERERNGVDFHFVSRAQFEADIEAGKFIECGQYQNQYYGTSIEAMKEVVMSKKVILEPLTDFINSCKPIDHLLTLNSPILSNSYRLVYT